MAVTFVRSALMVPGKFPQAHEYIEKRIKWLKEKFGVEASLMVLLGGQVGRMRECLDGINRALNQISVGDPNGPNTLASVRSACRAVGA